MDIKAIFDEMNEYIIKSNIEFKKQKSLERKEKTKKNKQEYNKIYNLNNKDKIKEYNLLYFKNRRQIEPLFKLRTNTRNLILNSIKRQGYTKQSKTFEILGCSYKEFKQHLERQFTKGMTWQNQGEWHLDHIYPVSLAKDEAEIIKLNHYTNFQPLWAKDNLEKNNKIIPNTQIKLI